MLSLARARLRLYVPLRRAQHSISSTKVRVKHIRPESVIGEHSGPHRRN